MLSDCSNHLEIQGHSWILVLPSTLGFLIFLNYLLSILKWTYTTIFRPPKDLKKYGTWALITGCTDGIGKALSRRLAREGLNLILVSRSHEKLKAASLEIQEEFPLTKTKIVSIDLSDENEKACVRAIEEAVEGEDVGILVNNAGITYPNACYFHEVEEKIWTDIVKVNLRGTTIVTRAVLPGMLERKRGAIVNIGSGASIVVPSHPLYAIYAATKAFIDRLSRSLHVEYRKDDIHLQCQVPLYVATKMASRVAYVEKPSFFIPSPDDYARAAIRYIGYEVRCTPCWTHSLQWLFASLLPEAILDSWRLSIGLKRKKTYGYAR